MKLQWLPRFVLDLEECPEYLAEEAGEPVVEQWRVAMRERLELLAQFPEAGRLRSDLPQPGIRSINLRKYPDYLICYRI